MPPRDRGQDFDEEIEGLKLALSGAERKALEKFVGWNSREEKSITARKTRLVSLAGDIASLLIDKKIEDTPAVTNIIIFAQTQDPLSGPSSSQGSVSGGGAGGKPKEGIECPTPLDREKLGITFNDIAGNFKVKELMKASYIFPFVYRTLFRKVSKGILLYGPPGTGKSLMAKAATAEIPKAFFFAPAASDIKGKYLGETEKNIHSIFECAGKALEGAYETKPSGGKASSAVSIIFMDEFDSIAKDRSEGEGMAASVNTLLQEMDGINVRENVSVLAATNYPWALDSAILRRFTNTIFVDLPDPEAIEFLVRYELANNYTPPGSPFLRPNGNIIISKFYDPYAEGEEKFVFHEGDYMDHIKDYGGFVGQTEQKGWFVTRTEVTDSFVDDDFIVEMVGRLGPTPEGLSFRKDMDDGKPLSCEDPRLAKNAPIFGYSPSDITRIMRWAINYASMRALSLECKKVPFGKHEYWVAGPNFTGGILVDNVPDNERDRIITFDIRQSDLNLALNEIGSTIKNVEYYKLLFYSKFGVPPEC
jgi:SpoVK/Ycf46/Vps4 family AAA+-type ATPase